MHQQSLNQPGNQLEHKLKAIIVEIVQAELGMNEKDITDLLQRKEIDYMLGCLFGAFIGDSLGSHCQFMSKQSSTKIADETMQMPGGGPFRLKSGQITDDSEMALHMLIGLNHYDNSIPLQDQLPVLLVAIAKQYLAWARSNPFDMGLTCSAALNQLSGQIELQQKRPTKLQTVQEQFKNLQQAHKGIAKANEKSLSNGFLMRISPLVCFISLLNIHKPHDMPFVRDLIEGETNMTHSNQQCIDANSLFIRTLVSLICREEHEEILDVQQKMQSKYKNVASENVYGSAIQQAFIAHRENKELMIATKHEGFFKIAFFYSYYSLRQIAHSCKTQQDLNPDVYKTLIKLIVSQGGDTDTNACIAGSLIGSILGFNKLPKEYLIKMLSLQLKGSNARPGSTKYEPKNAFINLISLIKKFK